MTKLTSISYFSLQKGPAERMGYGTRSVRGKLESFRSVKRRSLGETPFSPPLLQLQTKWKIREMVKLNITEGKVPYLKLKKRASWFKLIKKFNLNLSTSTEIHICRIIESNERKD